MVYAFCLYLDINGQAFIDPLIHNILWLPANLIGWKILGNKRMRILPEMKV